MVIDVCTRAILLIDDIRWNIRVIGIFLWVIDGVWSYELLCYEEHMLILEQHFCWEKWATF
jgi:hypothetical protein